MSKKFQDDVFLDWLGEEARLLPFVSTIEKYTKIPAWFQLFFYIGWLLKQCFLGNIGNMLATLVGTFYPAFKSIKALQTKEDPEDDKVWLTYWVVYGFVCFADLNIGWILSHFPGYYIFKLLFFLWLQLPLGPLMGANIMYKLLFKQVYNIFGKRINAAVKRTSAKMNDYDKLIQNSLNELSIQASAQATGFATEMMIQKAQAGLIKELEESKYFQDSSNKKLK